MQIALNAAINDVMHKGHHNLYKYMRDTGKKVIVILHDDYSCYEIKCKFPVHRLGHRIENLYKTGLVDVVLPTYSVDPSLQFEQVIKEYGPENVTYVRGDDLVDDFPGKYTLDKHNIKIEYRPYTKGVSSTDIRNELCN
jgi:glycerol-3-phosphate cytidylyltransferase-like family protein